MERLSKIAIYMSMVIACSIFVMFAISVIPDVVSQVVHDWKVFPDKSAEEIKKLFYETDSYKAFNAKYPDNGEYHDYRDGYGRLELTAMNFESYNTLHLSLQYDAREDSVRENVRCESQKNNQNYSIRGTLTAQFIEKVDCLSGTGLVDAPSNLIYEDGSPVRVESSFKIYDDND